MRPATGQPVAAELTEVQRAQHNLTYYMLLCVSFEWKIMPAKMAINSSHILNQDTAVFLLTSVKLHKIMKKTKFVHCPA